MIGSFALFMVLFAQGTKPPESQRNAEILVAEARTSILGVQKTTVQQSPEGGLEQLDKELVGLYSVLSPSLVEVHFQLGKGTESERLLVTSGVILDNYGLMVVPIIVEEHQRNGILSGISVTRVDGEEFSAELLAQNENYGI